jgi:hypothetical protein
MSALPDSGWFPDPSRKWMEPCRATFRMKPYPNRSGVCIHEIHAEIAEYRLSHDGIKPELLAYLAGIGAAHG